MKFSLAITIVLSLCAAYADAEAPKALIHAHAHNDYNHKRPLLDALEHGFASIEADVFLKNGELLVGHDEKKLRPERTLKSLYLDPLQKHIAANHGRVFAGPERLTLLIDFKSDGPSTYAALARELKQYDGVFSDWIDGKFTPRLVDVVVTGNRPIEQIAADRNRRVAIDGRLADQGTGSICGVLGANGACPPSPSFVPLVSENWQDHFKWRGAGHMPPAERDKLRALGSQIHAQGRRLRFWGAPDNAAVWTEQRAADVDLLNADNLDALQAFLLKANPAARDRQ
jgi:hypothetical protein